MFKKILYPTDLSEESSKALSCLVEMKGSGIKEVILLHVISQSEAESTSDSEHVIRHSKNPVIVVKR